jgi:hypothetical protein
VLTVLATVNMATTSSAGKIMSCRMQWKLDVLGRRASHSRRKRLLMRIDALFLTMLRRMLKAVSSSFGYT